MLDCITVTYTSILQTALNCLLCTPMSVGGYSRVDGCLQGFHLKPEKGEQRQ